MSSEKATSAPGIEEEKPASPGITGAFGNFFGGNSSSSSESSTIPTSSSGTTLGDPERKRKLAKRLMDITTKLEDISNQIYHLGQRVEFLEKKVKASY